MSLRTAKDATPKAVQALANDNIVMAVRIKQLEAMISGLMEAMKPLLEEWRRLKPKESTNE